MKKNKFEFIIDPEFQSQIPALTDEEFQQLEENILSEGQVLSPLIPVPVKPVRMFLHGFVSISWDGVT